MAKVVPFCGMRYNTDMIKDLADVIALPYDVISEDDQQRLYNMSEHNIVRVDYGLGQNADTEDNNRYTRGGEFLRNWIEEQILVRDSEPAFYVYEQIFSLNDGKAAHSLKGIISLVELCEYSERIVIPHEEAVSKETTDRISVMRATGANTSPVYCLYPDAEEKIANFIEEKTDGAPDVSFESREGVWQNIWIINDKETTSAISKMFENKQLFIADGHHRYETALEYRSERHEADGTTDGSMDYDYIMMMLVSMSSGGLFTFPTHRLVRGIENFDETLTVSFLTQEFLVSKIHFTEGDFAKIISDRLANTVDEKLFAMYTGKNYYYLLKLKDTKRVDRVLADMSEAYRHLDVMLLQKMILEECFDIDEEEAKQNTRLVYTRDAAGAVAAVKEGEYQCAFMINPTKVSELYGVAKAGERMPRESTHFWPKLVNGLVINKFED